MAWPAPSSCRPQVYGRAGRALPQLRRHPSGASCRASGRRSSARAASAAESRHGLARAGLRTGVAGRSFQAEQLTSSKTCQASMAASILDAPQRHPHAGLRSPAASMPSATGARRCAAGSTSCRASWPTTTCRRRRPATRCSALRERLASDKLVVAFVAEFSRGKSELINAIFFADTGRRVLPATPGRTTMCPVELGFDAERAAVAGAAADRDPAATALSLTELRAAARRWTRVAAGRGRRRARWPQALQRSDAHPVGQRRARPRRSGFWDDDAARRQPAASTTTAASRCRPGAMRSSTTRIRCCSRAWWCSTRRG